jgi:hypothetical protein
MDQKAPNIGPHLDSFRDFITAAVTTLRLHAQQNRF